MADGSHCCVLAPAAVCLRQLLLRQLLPCASTSCCVLAPAAVCLRQLLLRQLLPCASTSCCVLAPATAASASAMC